MLELDVEVEGDVGAVDLVAAVVGTGEILFDFNGQAPIFLPVLEFVQFEVLLLEGLNEEGVTSSFSTSVCRCVVLSDMSLISEKLSSFFR